MLLFDGAFGLLMIGLWLFCIIDVITTPEASVRNLPKLFWLLIVILLSSIGSIAWLVAGRDWSGRSRDPAYKVDRGSRDAGARATASTRGARRPTNPDDDEEFLAGLRARAEEQRRRAQDNDPDGTG